MVSGIAFFHNAGQVRSIDNFAFNSGNDPQVEFKGTGVGTTNVNLAILDRVGSTSGTTLSFEGSDGQLLGIVDNLTSGTIFSVADIAGLPIMEADASGDVKLTAYGRNVGVAMTGTPAYQLDVYGTGNFASGVRFPDGTVQTSAYTGPGGSDTQIQFNAGGTTFEGDNALVWNSGTNVLTISGHLAATTKSFLIDHPTIPEKKLQYACLEGPENGVYVRGHTNDNIIDLPDYWTALVDQDSITVQITAKDAPQPYLYVSGVANNQVHLISDRSVSAYYTVNGTRKDVDPLQVEI